MQKIIAILCLIFLSAPVFAQPDTTSVGLATGAKAISCHTNSPQLLSFNYKALIIPSALVAYGFVALDNHRLQSWNTSLQNEVQKRGHPELIFDDFSRFAPALSVYVLNAVGIRGRNNLKDRSVILGTATLLMLGTTYGLKAIIKEQRPDGSTSDSFPSGHTALAFMGAEFLHQEYRDQSVWYGVAGYVVASGTGILRMYNNRHWFSDVVAGAGVGILSTKVAYWVHPWMNETLFNRKNHQASALALPYYNGKQAGLCLSVQF